jgi:hypothetical protein
MGVAGLDLFVAGHGSIKIGHLSALIFGLAAGMMARSLKNRDEP